MRRAVLFLLLIALPSVAPSIAQWRSDVARRVAVVGDLSTARDVVVLVPGSDVDVGRFERTVGRMASNLYEQARRDDLAVIAWLGYRTPQGLGVDAMTGSLARQGADALVDFVRSLRTPARVHVVGHSYGSVVVGLAAHELDVADVVFTGSPGVRADSVAQLGTGARVWALRSSGDWMRFVPNARLLDLGHGTDPASDGFGATALRFEGGKHDTYYEPGSETLNALVRIVSGSGEKL
ncbi:alpha/beta hydrolase [Lentzea flaviverrucosa]|uniref:Alpha/beta hydrolase n=1 Tax=Lentzea flaviverrucosa TaxID=200379 RepID=A0A1H9U9L5_9PSEU|nr:alpha/beta hydrolase [Lentzea flaviverrucosa]RDI33238.1 alpha/beta hydrolase family protein [Lentzea flaviverrucosa]SES05951.1 Alpha/beta hydrolase [Lentzea flaviverrucosa]